MVATGGRREVAMTDEDHRREARSRDDGHRREARSWGTGGGSGRAGTVSLPSLACGLGRELERAWERIGNEMVGCGGA